jgi:saccharopine dehydrogenase-like NADP-dependent oxidoreductase
MGSGEPPGFPGSVEKVGWLLSNAEVAMKKVVVLGAGLVGKEVAKDLSKDFEVTSVDSQQDNLTWAFDGTPVLTWVADLSDAATIREVVETADVVVGALPGSIGRFVLENVIAAGKDVVDIAFFPEDPFELDQFARDKGVTAIVDFGIAPGMSNLFMGHHNAEMKHVEKFDCMVGGLPVIRDWPFEYKAGFSPADVVEEYTRPARYVDNGRMVTRPALSDPELVRFDGIGALEALNTDGLRTLATTMKAPFMKEKTLRYPGHGRFMEALRMVGFFDKEPIEVHGEKVVPLEFTSAIMFPHWTFHEGEEEFTVMRVVIEGESQEGTHERITYDLLDRYDIETGVSSMARTTSYTCTAGVHLIAEGMFTRKGICPPEYVGEDPLCTEFVLDHLAARNVTFQKRVELLDEEWNPIQEDHAKAMMPA